MWSSVSGGKRGRDIVASAKTSCSGAPMGVLQLRAGRLQPVLTILPQRRQSFLLGLYSCFQTETGVYFVMEYISRGDFKHGCASEVPPANGPIRGQ